ncbi:Hypothetical predicted protein [Lecanosticta acicola]|uniref:Uncharacterized protein n=1 Tax=Lecanosticta acicola TaxID=111012 RepID=A0AAI8YXF2_9PEZI|nr:Hypothetical predicted protein [Lecanosticta acicola]
MRSNITKPNNPGVTHVRIHVDYLPRTYDDYDLRSMITIYVPAAFTIDAEGEDASDQQALEWYREEYFEQEASDRAYMSGKCIDCESVFCVCEGTSRSTPSGRKLTEEEGYQQKLDWAVAEEWDECELWDEMYMDTSREQLRDEEDKMSMLAGNYNVSSSKKRKRSNS